MFRAAMPETINRFSSKYASKKTRDLLVATITVFPLTLLAQVALLSSVEGYSPFEYPLLYYLLIAITAMLTIPIVVWLLGDRHRKPLLFVPIILSFILVGSFWIYFVILIAPAILELLVYSSTLA